MQSKSFKNLMKHLEHEGAEGVAFHILPTCCCAHITGSLLRTYDFMVNKRELTETDIAFSKS